MRAALSLAAFLLAASAAAAFYLPGVAPYEYADGEQVDLKVNKMTSTKSALTYNNYDLQFCPPEGGPKDFAENLGEHLTGDVIENSPYQLFMFKTEYCKVLCTKELSLNEVNAFVNRIRLDYHLNWMVDTLPAAVVGVSGDNSVVYSRGVPIGTAVTSHGEPVSWALYNHASITVRYHTSADYAGKRVVGFEVAPHTIRHVLNEDGTLATCNPSTGALVNNSGPMAFPKPLAPVVVTWSYDVSWEWSAVQWASRWDIYLSMGGKYSSQVHWFSILNSTIIVVFLTGMVAMILVRAVYRDLSRYNRVATDEEKAEDREETGWKLVHADVFRPPARMPMLFAVAVGVGTQVFGMALSTIFFAAAGFLSPANRGSLMIALLLLFLLMGVTGGYSAARTHKMLNGVSYQRCTLLVGVGFPGLIFSLIFLMNLFVWADGSTTAIPFLSMFTVLLLWLAVSLPLVFVGAYHGFKKDKVAFPVAVGAIPRPIPPQQWYLSPALSYTVGGVLPFGAVFVELYFILSSIFMNQYYYVFGFLLLVFGLLVVTCAEIAIVIVYFQLCGEDYRWWWRSVLAPGASSLYVFGYSLYYLLAKLDIEDRTTMLLYLGYVTIVTLLYALLTGAVGFWSTLWFTRVIYGNIKVD